ncbi:TfoX/Sxy family protein [Hahella aquimaris]|uniref:TfoX/Sxy family protein n=1 Tax=Hahella sp. HNIBRBA332 TaxID=3015983 RepID=UPI00273C56CE|nr:TfoX/Sxy family protein [Hahella sp. HNIBRBA332]WLQ15726.1 TfoX/Sxy family protein [Hahella sp. HNIBRBA332]
MIMRLRDLKGLGPKSEKDLIAIGVDTPEKLREIGPVRTFLKLKQASAAKPSLNFLYAMVGAVEDRHWMEIAKSEKTRLLMELEGYRELEEILRAEGLSLDQD